MSMMQLVIGTALGFMVAQGVLYGMRRLIGWLANAGAPARVRLRIPMPGPGLVSGFIRYAAPVGASVAVITLGVWAVSDYLAARSVRRTALADPVVPAHAPTLPPPAEEPADVASAATSQAGDAPAAAIDPYADPAFKVQHHQKRTGSATLKDTLVQREEAKARAELLSEMQQHVQRSQYDCEAAQHAEQYLKAGLDVWGFAAWQGKYFPVDSYKGATLPQCKDIKDVVASSLQPESSGAPQGQS